jgi:hypothetical protein
MKSSALISQAQFAALCAKTDMRQVATLVKTHGRKAAAEYVRENFERLAKDSTTSGITTGTGLNFIDLRAPAYMLNPVWTPIRNSTPRWDKVNAGYGVQPQWKAITNINGNGQVPFVSEGNTNSYGSFTEKDYSRPYVTLGTDDFVTYESMSASEGFEDVASDAKQWQLLRFMIQQESTYIGGASAGGNGTVTSLQIGTTNTPAGVLSALNNSIYVTGVLPIGSYAAAYAVALNYRGATNPTNTVTNGITTQYLRSNADGSTDVINGGSAIVSAASAVAGPTTNLLRTVQFSCTPQAGAWGYAWFVEINTSGTFAPSPSLAKLTAITAASTVNIYGQTQGTQTAAYAGAGGYAGFATDLSTNALDMDGLLTIASNSTYTIGLPTWSYPANSTQTALAGGVDLHGAGLTNGGMVGSITEFDTLLFAIQQSALTSPTKIYLSTDQVDGFRKAFLVGATGSTAANFFFPDGGPKGDMDGLSINTRIAMYQNVFSLGGTGGWIDVIQHPTLPYGTILFDVDTLGPAYENSRLGETRGVFVRRDTYGIEFAQTSRKLPFGVFSEEVLAVKTPNIIGFIKGAGKFGQAALF